MFGERLPALWKSKTATKASLSRLQRSNPRVFDKALFVKGLRRLSGTTGPIHNYNQKNKEIKVEEGPALPILDVSDNE